MLGWTYVTAAFVAAPVWLLLLCFPLLRGGWKYHLPQAGVFLGQWALIGLWLWLDPGHLLNWLLD